ncbi:MAG: TlpA family protein disulfide reductase [Bacteroidetes bacterium]|nr:TlpA family protein disulfide reductase [Bacteroidota bacterium]
MSLLTSLIITTGLWKAVLFTPGGELPFQLEIKEHLGQYSFTIINGNEHMLLDEVTIKDDSVIVKFPVYESELRLKITNKNLLDGSFINLTRATHGTIRLQATAGSQSRFAIQSNQPPLNIAGKWSVLFSPGTSDSSFAVGVFEQKQNHITGTFLTTSGDYRYLEGVVDGDSLFLSTFNGVFVYLFKAKITGNSLSGRYYSGTHYQTSWVGLADNNAQLPDPSTLTKIRGGDQGLAIRFPDLDSNWVSLEDSKYKEKVIVLQIMGSWCPNCLDETEYLAPYYDKNKARGMEIIGLSFEKTNDFSKAAENVKKLRKRLNIKYTLLIAAHRDQVRATIPGIENFMGFPTTIFLDKTHKVRKIHAGFNGAATGTEYEKFKDDFEAFMNMLLKE